MVHSPPCSFGSDHSPVRVSLFEDTTMPLSYGIWAVAALGNIAMAMANDASVVCAFFMFIIEVSKNYNRSLRLQ